MPETGRIANPKGDQRDGGRKTLHINVLRIALRNWTACDIRSIDRAEYDECQYEFNKLLEHHDLRERNLLYPFLDRCTTLEERQDLPSRMRQAI